MRKMILEIIDSYEKRIKAVSEIIEGAHDLIENFRERRKVMLEELRSNLAHSEFLRKKDFDEILSLIHLRHKEREDEVRAMLRNYLDEHKHMANVLRAQLEGDNETRRDMEQERIHQFRLRFEQIKKEQEMREIEVKMIMGRYLSEQNGFTEVINDLLKKGQAISTHELKCAIQVLSLNKLNSQHNLVNINKKENSYVIR